MIDTKQRAKYILEEYVNCYSQVDLEELAKYLGEIKAEAYKECIEKVEKIICDNTYPDFDVNHKAVNIWKAEAYKDINNLLKKLGGE